MLVAAIATVLWMWARTIAFPYPVDYGEGPLLTTPCGSPPVRPATRCPQAKRRGRSSTTHPLLSAGQRRAERAVGPAFWYGRLLSVIGALTAAVFAGLIVVVITEDRTAAMITALMMPVVPCLGYWAALARVDTVALAASLIGLWCVVRRPGSTRWLVAGMVAMAVAACTRQSYLLAAPLTAAAWLWPSSRRRALGFAGGVLGSVLVIWVVLNLLTHGAFWFDIVRANVNVYDPELLAWYVEGIIWTVPVLLAVLGVALVVTVRAGLASARFLVPYAAAALVVFATAGKVGSSLNYLLELGTAACLAAGFLLASLRNRSVWRAVALAALLPPRPCTCFSCRTPTTACCTGSSTTARLRIGSPPQWSDPGARCWPTRTSAISPSPAGRSSCSRSSSASWRMRGCGTRLHCCRRSGSTGTARS